MKIGELSRRSGLSIDTIRWYERIGLLPPAYRSPNRQREFDENILTWIAFLGRLKTTRMPIRDMLTYARLRETGDGTLAARRQLLEAHRTQVQARLAELQSCLATLDAKIDFYAAQETAP